MNSNIHTEFHRFLTRENKESLLKQRGLTVWMSGLSGSGKSTIANAAERILHQQGRFTIILDGDNVRSGLNANLTFTDEDRLENIRRIAELAKILTENGVIVLVSAITPKGEHRDLARGILNQENLLEVHIKASFEACQQRDVKGLYAKAAQGEIPNFSGQSSTFETPHFSDLTLDTESLDIEEATSLLLDQIYPRIKQPLIH